MSETYLWVPIDDEGDAVALLRQLAQEWYTES